MKRGDIYWINFDPSVGTEIKKIRPAVIVSNDISNLHLSRLQVIPLTTNIARVYKTEVLIDMGKQQAKAMGSQITTIDKQRLDGYLGKVSFEELEKIDETLRIQLGLF